MLRQKKELNDLTAAQVGELALHATHLSEHGRAEGVSLVEPVQLRELCCKVLHA